MGKTRSGETVKRQQKSGVRLICLALLIIVVTLVSAGCMESTPDTQNRMTATSENQSENPAAGTTITTRTTTAQSLSAPDPSAPFITVDPIGDKNIGDLIVISGTTNLPEKTAIYLYRTFGNSGDEKMMSNRQVLPGTNGTNRWRFAFDSGGFRPGSYKLTVATPNKDVSGSAQFSLAGTFLGTDRPIYYSGTSKSGSAGTSYITVQPPGDRQQGDVFVISGTTSLAEGTLLFCRVYPAYFEDKTKKPASSSGGPTMDNLGSDTIVIRDSGNTNRWSFAMDTESYQKIEYIVNVSTVNEDFTLQEIFGSTQFTLR